MVFFGELHDNPIAHWLELEVTKSIFDSAGKNLVIAAEMFEADNQLLLDEYFAGIIKVSLLKVKFACGRTMVLTTSHF